VDFPRKFEACDRCSAPDSQSESEAGVQRVEQNEDFFSSLDFNLDSGRDRQYRNSLKDIRKLCFCKSEVKSTPTTKLSG